MSVCVFIGYFYVYVCVFMFIILRAVVFYIGCILFWVGELKKTTPLESRTGGRDLTCSFTAHWGNIHTAIFWKSPCPDCALQMASVHTTTGKHAHIWAVVHSRHELVSVHKKSRLSPLQLISCKKKKRKYYERETTETDVALKCRIWCEQQLQQKQQGQ